MEDRWVDRVADHDGVTQLDPDSLMCLEAEQGLDDGGIGQFPVHRGDTVVCSVIAAAIDANGSVDSMHHPAVATRETPEPPEVKVE